MNRHKNIFKKDTKVKNINILICDMVLSWLDSVKSYV